MILVDKDHTSKCSFLDCEPIEHREYIGRRIKGLFRSARGIINADVNAAYNIIRKAIPPEAFADGIAGAGLHPDGLMMKSHEAF